jgi:hypothetical protein
MIFLAHRTAVGLGEDYGNREIEPARVHLSRKIK